MPDDDDFIFPPGLPEELKEQIKRMRDRHNMHSQSTRQAISRLFQELKDDQLETLTFLFSICGQGQQVASYYEGFTKALLVARTGIWPGWDENDSLLPGQPDLETSVEVVLPVESPKQTFDEQGDFEARLAEYRLERTDDPAAPFVCINCKMPYQSLADRMLKKPDECSGCIQKAKFG